MSGAGAPSLQTSVDPTTKIAIVASQWHQEIMDGLIEGAQRALSEAGVASPVLVRAPGSFELPVLAKALIGRGYQGVVALGVVIRGGTPHFDYVCQATTAGITQLAVETGVPIGFGLLTTDNEQQALDRAGLPDSSEDKGREAAEAVLSVISTLKTL